MFTPDSYQIICAYFPRLLGLIYIFTFFPFLFQIRGLIGENGILPVHNFLKAYKRQLGNKRFYLLPSVFWINGSDKMLLFVPFLGTFLGFLLMLGYYPCLLLPILVLLHISIISAGQDFLSFGWEMYFCEISINTFLLSLTNHPNLFAWISINLLLFRFHLKSGTSKLQSGDATWRNFTTLEYHYETQPIPNGLSWYFHKFPAWFQKVSTLFVLFLEIVVPFGVLGDENMRFATFILLFLLQASIWISGNYSYLNYLTAVFTTLLISDSFFPFQAAAKPDSPFWLHNMVALPALGLIALQLLRIWNDFFYDWRIEKFLSHFQPFHLCNRYGIFSVMTTLRYEIVIEGSADGENWQEYLFYYKPSEVERRPRQIAPYQPRLDWSAWFLPFTTFDQETWFQNLLYRLLQGKKEVLKLLRYNPFPDAPPKFIRAKLYLYKFTTAEQKKKTGHWWVREYVGDYAPVLNLRTNTSS